MKILWMSDSPTSPSGYGNIARHVCAGLAARGHQVSIIGWQHRRRMRWRGCPVFPIREDPFGADVLQDVIRETQPDVLVTAADAWRVFFAANPAISRCRRAGRIPWVLYHAIDSDLGEGRLPSSLVRALRTVDLPVAMSAYGRDLTDANGVPGGAYVPVGVDLNVFRPPEDRAAAKRRLGYEGKFVVLSDARNQPRKLLPRALDIFRRFARGKEDVRLHLHCDPNDPASRTEEYHYRVEADIPFLGLEGRVGFTPAISCPNGARGVRVPKGVTLARLGALYQAADVHLLASYGEGFGLPTLQAAAAGLVPLAVDYSASRELVLGHGEPLRVRHFVTGALGLRMALLDIDHAVECLERLYADRELLAAKSAAARSFAEGYAWEDVVDRWDVLLREEEPRLRAVVAERLTESGAPAHRQLATNPARAAAPDEPSAPLDEEIERAAAALEALGGHLAAEFLRDGARFPGAITLPVTPGPPEGQPGAERVPGRLYLAGAGDLPVFRALRQIFPGLNPVSTSDLDAPGQPAGPGTPAPAAPTRDELLAGSTLVLDVEGRDPGLPDAAARAGVPCISPARNGRQAELWPALALRAAEDRAAELGRWVLTDQGVVVELCAAAYRRCCAARV